MYRKPAKRSGRTAPTLENVLSVPCGRVICTVLYNCPLGKGGLTQPNRSNTAEITRWHSIQQCRRGKKQLVEGSIFSQIPSQHETRLPVRLPLTDALENVSRFWSLSSLLTGETSETHLE